MGKKSAVLVDRLRRENDDFVFWEGRHETLGHEIRLLNKMNHLTPQEDLQRKELQKEKLIAKDKMMEILRSFELSTAKKGAQGVV